MLSSFIGSKSPKNNLNCPAPSKSHTHVLYKYKLPEESKGDLFLCLIWGELFTGISEEDSSNSNGSFGKDAPQGTQQQRTVYISHSAIFIMYFKIKAS